MLGADCDFEGRGGVGRAKGEVMCHLPGVVQFVGNILAVDN